MKLANSARMSKIVLTSKTKVELILKFLSSPKTLLAQKFSFLNYAASLHGREDNFTKSSLQRIGVLKLKQKLKLKFSH